MKRLITIAGLTLFVGIPATADIDWIGNRVDANLYKRRMEHMQGNTRRQKKTKRTNRTTRKTTSTPRRTPERYPLVEVDGKQLKTTVPATQIDGTTFVPFRDIFEALGAVVQYDDQKRLVTATRENRRMELLLPGGDSEVMSGQRVSIGRKEKPFIRNGATMVPLRMVSEKMGAKVGYTQRQGTPLISIASPQD